MKRLTGLMLLILLAGATRANDHHGPATGGLSIKFDLENAKQTILLLQKTAFTDKELQEWIKLPGTAAVISKIKSSPDTAISALKKVVSHQTLTARERNFQYDLIYNNLARMQEFVSKLEASSDSIVRELKNKLGKYIPTGQTIEITLYGLMGSYSAGFAFTGNSSAFFIGLHQYKADVLGVAVSAEHELFHTLQSANYDFKPVMEKVTKIDSTYEAPYYLLTNLYLEGSAQFIADGSKFISTSPFLKNEQEHMDVNNYRDGASYYIFERMVMDVYRHPSEMNFPQVYNILFDWNWNNPGYYAGQQMMKALVKENGEDYIEKSLKQDALFFVRDYIMLAKTKKELALYQFSPDFEKLLNDMINKL